MKIVCYEDYEIRFFSGIMPEVFKGNDMVAQLDTVFWMTSCEGFSLTAYYLYFKDTATSLVRLSFKDLTSAIEEGQKMIKIEEIARDVEAYYAQGPSYWLLNKQGEIKSYGPLSAVIKLGPNIEVTSTSILAPLGLNLLVGWHSFKANKNHFVLFSKQMEYFSSMSIEVKEGSRISLSAENRSCHTVRTKGGRLRSGNQEDSDG